MTAISDERIAQIEARRDELQAKMATGQLDGEAFVAASKDYAEIEPPRRRPRCGGCAPSSPK
jgi:peptide chain release factor 1